MPKRPRESQSNDDAIPPAIVKVNFFNLPAESRQRLGSVLREWAEWHADKYPQGYRPPEVSSAQMSFQPDLVHLGVWEEKPSVPNKVASATMWFNIAYEKVGDVPAYDRATATPLQYEDPRKKRGGAQRLKLSTAPAGATAAADGDGDGGAEGGQSVAGRPAKRARAADANRCFNCGSYAHSMRECWREYNRDLVEQSKKEFAEGKEAGGVYRSAAKRYFLAGAEQPGGRRKKGGAVAPPEVEFEDVRPGQLSEGMRSALGLGPLDPPPWLPRMKAMGPPPGYRMKASRRRKQPQQGADSTEQHGTAGLAPVAAGAHAPSGVNGHAAANGLGETPSKAQQQVTAAPSMASGEQGAGTQLANGVPAPAELAREHSLESGELAEGEEGDGFGGGLEDFIAFDGSAGASGGEVQGQGPAADVDMEADVAPVRVPDPLEDFIPFECTPQPSESEGEEEVGPGGGGGGMADNGDWESTWVYGVQFPGVNAPIPEGADPAKWAQGPPADLGLPPGFAGASGGVRQHTPHRTPGSVRQQQDSRLGLGRGIACTREPTPVSRYHPSPGGSDAVTPQPQPSHQQQQQQPWQPRSGGGGGLQHMPSAPALLQHHNQQQQYHTPEPLRYSPHSGGQQAGHGSGQEQQQQYSPIVQHPPPPQHPALMTRHASLTGLAPPPQQPQQHVLPHRAGPPFQQHHHHQQPQQFAVSPADPGHLLASAGPLHPMPSPQPQQQLYAATSGSSQAFTQAQLQVQPSPMYAVHQMSPQPPQQPAQQQQQQVFMMGPQGVLEPYSFVAGEAYNPDCPGAQGGGGYMPSQQPSLLLQQQHQQQQQQQIPPGFYKPW